MKTLQIELTEAECEGLIKAIKAMYHNFLLGPKIRTSMFTLLPKLEAARDAGKDDLKCK